MGDYQLVSGCTIEDARLLAKNNLSAFYTQAWWRIIWGDRPFSSLLSALEVRLPWVLLTARPIRRLEKVVHTPTGDIVGFARWIVPESLANDWLEAQTPDVAEETKIALERQFNEADWRFRVDTDSLDAPVSAMTEKYTPKYPFIKLDYLAIHPDHHRKGVGRKLVQSGLDRAEQLNMPVFLLATSKISLELYKTFGFRLLEGLNQSLEEWGETDTYDTYAMIHDAGVRTEAQTKK